MMCEVPKSVINGITCVNTVCKTNPLASKQCTANTKRSSVMLLHHLTQEFTNTQPGTPLALIGKPTSQSLSAQHSTGVFYDLYPTIQIIGSVFKLVNNIILALYRIHGASVGID